MGKLFLGNTNIAADQIDEVTAGAGVLIDGVLIKDGLVDGIDVGAALSGTVDVVSNVATSTILGRVTAGSGDSEELTATQVRTLINVANGATANSADATLLNRANHTGTQTASTISDFSTAADARISAAIGVSVQGYNANTTTLGNSTTGTGSIVLGSSPTIVTPTIASFVNATHTHQNAAGGGTLDHGAALTGLTDDDHTQYALLAGRGTGQTLIGGTASGNNLTLQSTSNATRGKIIFGSAATSAYDEVNDRLGIGIASPSHKFELTNSTNTRSISIAASATTVNDIYLTSSNNGAGGTSQLRHAIYLSATGVGGGMFIESASTRASSTSLLTLNDTGASNTRDTLIINQAGTGFGLNIAHTGNASALNVTNTGNTAGYAVLISTGRFGLQITGSTGFAAININTGGNINLAEGSNIVLGTTTGTKIGTSTTQKLGFFNATPIVQPSAYTASNVTTDRSYDANATTIDEIADVLGTLITDLKALGLIG